jgi:nucleoside phosphorylase
VTDSGVLLVAATALELCGRPGLVCGVGPVEAAAATARRLALGEPRAVLHVGLAGASRLDPGVLVIGTESAYCDLSAAIPFVDRAAPDARLVAALQEAFPDAVSLPIATSAAVSAGDGAHDYRVEAMEGFGVLRACELAGVPAVEVRAVSNDLGEVDRERWTIARGLEALGEALPRLLAALSD